MSNVAGRLGTYTHTHTHTLTHSLSLTHTHTQINILLYPRVHAPSIIKAITLVTIKICSCLVTIDSRHDVDRLLQFGEET